MRMTLNRHFPFDTIARWWYCFLAFPMGGFLFSRLTDPDIFTPVKKSVSVEEGSPPVTRTFFVLIEHQTWNYDLLFAVVGLFVSCGVVWILEEIRRCCRSVKDQ